MQKNAYVGFYQDSELPVKQGMEVVIPKGIRVTSTNPSKKEYVTKRAQTVTVHVVLPGEAWEQAWDLGGALFAAARNPQVSWAGASGYWCDVELNDILDANNLPGAPEARDPKCYYVKHKDD